MAGDPEERNEEARTGEDSYAGRLRAARFVMLGLAAILALLGAGGQVSVFAAAVVLLGAAALLTLMPRHDRGPPRRLALRAPPSVWPETGIKRMADALPAACVILDRRGLVRYQNRLAETAFPVRPGDPLTFRLRAPDLLRAFERVAGGGPAERLEFAERVPTERWYDAWFSPIEAGGERSAGFVLLLLSDKTEQRRSERIRVDFVANASHELRTPLASLAGFIETLQGPARDDGAARERFLAIMHEQAKRMSRLIDDLLSLSRIEMKAHMRPGAPVELVALLSGVVAAMEPLAREQGVAIETDLPEPPLTVAGDRDELVQVFQNLVENACKYGRAGKRVVVELRAPAEAGADLRVTIRDFGPGIAAEHLPRLTERFYRADEAGAATRGTGLGLAIVKHILNRHRARLSIESRPGQGAAFSVEFPPAVQLPKQAVAKIS